MTAVDSTVPPEHPVQASPDQTPGARWWSVDIHAHSPASMDYGSEEGHDNDEAKPSFREWLHSYLDAGIDGVVITDHNTHEGIDQARNALEELRQENPGLRDLVLFPGVELTVSAGVHVLGIFDPSSSAETVNAAIARCRYDGVRGGSTQTADVTVVAAAQEIEGLGGICVPAHADQNAGILTRSELDLPTIKQSHVAAIEIIDDAKVADAERHGWVAVLGSDAHFLTTDGCPPGFEPKAPGTHFTRIKAERLDLEGLKLALTDARESIQRGRAGSTDPNVTIHAHIDQMTVTHKGSVETYKLNPWMNCLIGGRGVGKSTVLELIRLAMGRSGDLRDTALVSELQRFIPGEDRTYRWWDESTTIEVLYTRDNRPLRILWSGSEPDQSRIEAWNDTAWEPQAGRAADRAPIQVFSQKQIYELARQPQSFLTILDRMEDIRKAEWSEKYASLESEFRKAREGLRELLTETGRADRLRGQLQEVQGRLRHLALLRADARYQELESSELNLRLTAAAEQQAHAAVEQLRQQATALRDLAQRNREVPDYQRRTASFTEAAGAIDEAIARLQTAATDWQQADATTRWTARVDELSAWLAEQGGAATNFSPEQTNTDRQLEKQLEEDLLVFENTAERLELQELEIETLLAQLKAMRRELHDRRAAYVRSLPSGSDVRTRVRVFHQGGTGGIGDELRTVLNRPESFDNAFANDGIPKTLLDAQPKSPDFVNRIVPDFKDELLELVNRGADSGLAQRVRIDARFHRRPNDNERFDLETNVLLWFPEDLVTVEYWPDGSDGFVPVDQGSPGQKTAALLAIILQMGTEPLLLDQPEDDLENKLIKHLAVDTLKHIKRHRQLVISTHNANIVVTSAAEHVLVIQHGENLPGLEATGTLQTEEVKGNVCLILEGGEDAIKTRYKRLVG